MWWLLVLSVIQSVLLALGQVVLKIALQIMPPFGWNSKFWLSLLTNWQFALSGIIFGSASYIVDVYSKTLPAKHGRSFSKYELCHNNINGNYRISRDCPMGTLVRYRTHSMWRDISGK